MITTPWGDLEVADAHVHFFSPAFFRSVSEQKGAAAAPLLGWEEPATPEDLADRWKAEMDRHGVSQAMLIGSIPGDGPSVETAVERHPGCFRGIAMTNPLVAHGEVRNAFLFPAMHRYSLHDDKAWAAVQMVSGHPGALVYVHCGVLSVGFRKKLGLPCHFDMRHSNPIDLHALAMHFPRVNFVVPHFGAGFLREALMVADLCPNIYLDTSSSNNWMKYQPDNIDLDGVFRKALDVLGPSRLLFGTDSSFFPRGWVRKVFDAQVQALLHLGLEEEAARAIFGGNLRSLIHAASAV